MFFTRKRKSRIDKNVKVAEVYVVTAKIVSSYNNGDGCGPMCVTMYFWPNLKRASITNCFL